MKKLFLYTIVACFIFNATAEMERPLKDPAAPKSAGVHLLAEFWGATIIEDAQELQNILLEAVKEAGCTCVKAVTKKFEPQGITTMVLLTESHATIHTWPELDYIAIDFFACGDHAEPAKGIAYLQSRLQPRRIHVKELARGEATCTCAHTVKREEPLFGQELTIDLKGCCHEAICSKEQIKEYIDKLCILIDMKKYGEPFIERFAEHSEIAAGYSCAQMIETSLISGHFSEYLNTAYINIFSCKAFDMTAALTFTKEFFKAKNAYFTNTLR